MELTTAAFIFTVNLMNATHNPAWGVYDGQTMTDVVDGIVRTTSDAQLVETLIRIARWESGGFRKDIASCKVLGKLGERGAFQVYPLNEQEKVDLCSPDFAKQAAVALFHVNDSIKSCKRSGFKGSNLLTVYTHGRCHAAKDSSARIRWGDGKALLAIISSDEDKG